MNKPHTPPNATRYAPEGADPDQSPEAYLANKKLLRGLQIGLNVIVRVGRSRPVAQRRAAVWLFNYAKLQGLTTDELSERLDLEKPYIRAALRDIDTDASRFTKAVEKLRREFEAGIPAIVDSEVAQTVREGLSYAVEKKKVVEIIGLTRMGKTEAAWDFYLRHMDRGIMLLTPGEDESDRNFLWLIARAAGIGYNRGTSTGQMRPQLTALFGPGLLEFIIVDEAHFLWPQDVKTKPKRIEFLRGIWDKDRPAAAGVAILATPQYTNSSEAATKASTRWAPGQWDGRVNRFYLKDTMPDRDLLAIARHHAPDFTKEQHEFLVVMAKATEGFCGAMVNCIDRARHKAGHGTVTMEILTDAARQQVAGTRLQKLTEAQAAKKGRS